MKRRGFTLIELMVVIAIIIILAAVAIPNYLNMTDRAKRSRISSDFAALATALESYRTDWNQYPHPAAASEHITDSAQASFKELAGTTANGTAGKDSNQNMNHNPNMTATGDAAPIGYMTTNVLTAMKNPYTSANDYEYTSDGTTWKLVAKTGETATGKVGSYSRTDSDANLTPSTN